MLTRCERSAKTCGVVRERIQGSRHKDKDTKRAKKMGCFFQELKSKCQTNKGDCDRDQEKRCTGRGQPSSGAGGEAGTVLLSFRTATATSLAQSAASGSWILHGRVLAGVQRKQFNRATAQLLLSAGFAQPEATISSIFLTETKETLQG